MPTVLKKRVSGSDENFHIARPKHAAAIGLVSINWVSIEEGLQMFFQQILSYQLDLEWYQRDHPMLWANVGMILPVVESLRTKLDLITAVAEAILPKESTEEWKDPYAQLVRRAAGKRATIIHGRWGYSKEFPNHIVLRDAKSSTDTIYTEKDILFIAKEIRDLDIRLSKFYLKCHHAYGDRRGMPDNPPIPPRHS